LFDIFQILHAPVTYSFDEIEDGAADGMLTNGDDIGWLE
jgi:hypothetical protein